jgi:hypothetical protein
MEHSVLMRVVLWDLPVVGELKLQAAQNMVLIK